MPAMANVEASHAHEADAKAAIWAQQSGPGAGPAARDSHV